VGQKVTDEMTQDILALERAPTHPGEMLNEEFIKPLGITQSAFAQQLGISFPRLNDLIHGRRGVSTDTALRLAKVLGTSPELWLNLQQAWDLWHDRWADEVAFDFEGYHITADVPAGGGSSSGPARPRALIWGVTVGDTTHAGPEYTVRRRDEYMAAEEEVRSWVRQNWERLRPRPQKARRQPR
jgi:addiction module HigA family antidote